MGVKEEPGEYREPGEQLAAAAGRAAEEVSAKGFWENFNTGRNSALFHLASFLGQISQDPRQ